MKLNDGLGFFLFTKFGMNICDTANLTSSDCLKHTNYEENMDMKWRIIK